MLSILDLRLVGSVLRFRREGGREGEREGRKEGEREGMERFVYDTMGDMTRLSSPLPLSLADLTVSLCARVLFNWLIPCWPCLPFLPPLLLSSFFLLIRVPLT